MQNVIDFFTDSLLWPVYFGIIMYFVAWVGTRFFAGVFAKQLRGERNAIERGAIRASRLMIIVHFLFLSFFVFGLCVYTYPRVPDWTHILLYLISYIPFLIIDMCVLISLASQDKNSKIDNES